MLARWLFVASLMLGVAPLRAEDTADNDAAAAPAANVGSPLELQIELHRRGFSCGSIDGVVGEQTAAALRAYQRSVGLAETGALDPATRADLQLATSALRAHTVTPVEIGAIRPIPKTWLEKSQVPGLAFGSLLELIAERYHANPKLIRQLNPAFDWDNVLPGAVLQVPAVDEVHVDGAAARVVISLAARQLEVLDEVSRVIAHFPVSIAHMAEKRPVGQLQVTVVIVDPDYTFNPEVFPESAEARTLGRKLIIPPGPNNPVGRAWIGLDRPGYGIHGTPDPEKVGRTESHGCFRLANWDVLTLTRLVQVGTPVIVEP